MLLEVLRVDDFQNCHKLLQQLISNKQTIDELKK